MNTLLLLTPVSPSVLLILPSIRHLLVHHLSIQKSPQCSLCDILCFFFLILISPFFTKTLRELIQCLGLRILEPRPSVLKPILLHLVCVSFESFTMPSVFLPLLTYTIHYRPLIFKNCHFNKKT